MSSTAQFSPLAQKCLFRDVCCAVLSHSVVSDSVTPWTAAPVRLLSPWGFSRQEYWSGLPCPSPGAHPNPGIEPRSSALQADSLPSEPPGKCPKKRFLMLCAKDRDGSVQHVQTGLFSSGTNMALSAPRKLNLLNIMSLVYFIFW